MFEDRIREICLALGYEPEEFLLNSQATAVASVQAKAADGSPVVVRFTPSSGGETAVAKAFETQRWNTGRYATAYVTGAQSAGAALDPGRDEQVLQEMHLRWEVGTMAGGRPVNPVLAFGVMRKHLYQVRPFYPITLHHLIERQVSPGHAVLFRVVDQLWAALAFLHQPAVNIPHGAVTTHNAGFSSNRVIEASASLLDLKETPETRRAELKRKDFQDLGMLIYQFACSLEKPVDAVDAVMRVPNASWKQLGDKEKEWKSLVAKLLEPESFPFGFDIAGAREKLLGPLLPPKTPYTVIAKPVAVTTDPPYRQPEAELTETKAEIDYLGEMERLIAAADWMAALRMLLVIPGDFEPRERVVAWGNAIADGAGDDLGNQTEFLAGMEAMANLGSQRAGLRLGKWLAKNQPAEALSWLGAAADAGLTESYGVIALIYEQGGEGVAPEPERALAFYQASLDHYQADDWDTIYRMAAMILREKSLSERLAEGIRLLERCHANGHYRATDLLAQCYAQGHGMESDEKKAFQLFADAWNRSKKCNENYYTASNNLGVCFAIGFGIRKDPAMARHYFKQGEIAGHEASKKNLQALLQSA